MSLVKVSEVSAASTANKHAFCLLLPPSLRNVRKLFTFAMLFNLVSIFVFVLFMVVFGDEEGSCRAKGL